MTKKIENSSVSGKVSEPKKEAIDDVKKEDININNSKSVSLNDDLLVEEFDPVGTITNPDGTKSSWHNLNTYRESIENISTDPIVHISGRKIELVKSSGPENIEHPYVPFNSSILSSPVHSRRNGGRYFGKDVTDFKVSWWECEVSGIKIYITNGSELQISESLSSMSWDLDNDDTSKPVLVLIGSSIETVSLNIRNRNTINNSTITSTGNMTLTKSVVSATTLTHTSNMTIKQSKITSTSVYGVGSFSSHQSTIQNVSLTGFKSVRLTKVKTQGEEFKLDTYTQQAKENIGLDISNVDLSAFKGSLSSITEQIGSYKDTSWYGRDTSLIIQRRVDYGAFSGKESITFARLGSVDILVGSEIFKASEFFGLPETNIYPVAKDPAVTQEYPQPYQRGFSLPTVIGTGSTYRGSMLWNRAAKVIFGHNYGKTPISSSGEALIAALIEQIKSRIGIYVEFSNLKE